MVIHMDRLRSYAKLIVRKGVNVQKGQPVVIGAPVECAVFVRLLAEEAYEAGAREVSVRWKDDALTRLKYLKADDAVFDEAPEWMRLLYMDAANSQAACIAVYATDPENLRDCDPDRIQRANRAQSTLLKAYSDLQMAGFFPWCVVSVPTEAWAKKVFPDLSGAEAVARLWDAIYDTARVTADPVAAWEAHVAVLDARRDKLNEYGFAKLIFKNALGTDLTVELPDNHVWVSAGETAQTGQVYIANMPTEEIFTLPRRDGVNGVVVASKPLVLNGNLVEDFRFTFQDGRIVDVRAKTGLDILQNEISIDEGARYLGEVALVPFDSPINKSGILFYNTLFDENASCHLAFGKAYPCFSDARERTVEELTARGMNDSLTHEDFMVGTADLSVTGVTRDGTEVPVFINGNFAF